MLSVQSKYPSLAGLFNIPRLQGCTPCRQHPKHFGDRHSAKNLAQNLTKHDIKSCLKAIGCQISNLLFSAFTLIPRKGGEVACTTPYIAVIPASNQCLNSDLYGEFAGNVLKSQDIKKRSTNKCFGQKVDESIGQHCDDNNADAKKITPSYCQQSKPCYIFLSAAKSADGIGVPDSLSAIHDAPSVFFCVVGIAQPFFSNADIMRVAYQVMVGCSGAEKSAPVSDNAGYANPVQSTTSEIGVSGGGINYQLSEAAKWLLPSPQNRHLSGLSPLFAVIVRLSKQLFTILPHLQNAKPAYRSSKITFVSLPDALIRRCLMLRVYQSPCDLADKADTLLEVLNVIDGVIAQDCPNQKRTLTALNDLMRLAVHDLYCLLDGCEIRGGENA